MEPDKDGLRYRYGRHSLLEQRVLSTMLKAMPESIRQDVWNHRTMSGTSVLFKALWIRCSQVPPWISPQCCRSL